MIKGSRMCGNLEELSRHLALSSMQQCPEEYIKQTLIAHGFFKRSKNTDSSSQLVDKDSKDETTKNEVDDKGKPPGISEEDKRRTTQLISLVKEGREVHKLREPRSLYPLRGQQQLSLRNLPLWPAEVSCVKVEHRFVRGVPSSPERFLIPESEVVSPKIRSGTHRGTVVYTNPLGHEKFFTSSRAGPTLGLHSPSPKSESTTMLFESRFESGNLAKAVQVGQWDYELYLRYDLYTNKHTQWFHFSVSNMRVGQTYRFTIVNLYKAGSLYNEGMQPVMYSVVEAKQTGVGWRRAGNTIKYFKTNIRRNDTKHEAYHYGLTWSYKFEHDKDTCYFAHCYPYTYSDLQDYVQRLSSGSKTSGFVKARSLCHSIAGNSVPILTITSPVKSQTKSRAKKAVVMTARVHPGETNGSWMMKGFLDFLTGQSPDAKVLRENFVFKVIPMLNPDGVIVGNYRCSLAGTDLNRNYRSKLESYPTILAAKAMVKKLAEDREVVLYCDFHGHSKKQNVFIYGCDALDNPQIRLQSRVFPKMLSKNAPTMFSYKDSKFNVHKSKESTGRVVMWREMGVSNSYTMEATFCGSSLGRLAGTQFTTRDMETMGYHFCDTLLDYCDPDQSKVESILRDLEQEYRQLVLNRLASMGRMVPPGVDPLDLAADLGSEDESSDLGSNSSESDGPPVHLLAKEARKKKKKKLKTRRERNKHKALLKLTHTTIKAPESTERESTRRQTILIPTASAMEDSVVVSTSQRDSIVEVEECGTTRDQTRGGGVPVFVQERIDEKIRKRSELDVTKSPDHDYIEAVAMEYVRQSVLVREVAKQNPRRSLTVISRSGDCPISISSMAFYESQNKPPARPSSRLGNRPSLPQLGADDRTTGGAFASQYVAHHMVRESPSNQDGEGGGVNHTKSLANISRLFRQLKQQPPLHSEGVRNKLLGPLRPEDIVDSNISSTGSNFHVPSRVKLRAGTMEPPTLNTHSLSDKSLSGSDRNIAAKQSKIRPTTPRQSELRSKKSTKSLLKLSRTIEHSKENLTVHDKKVLAEVRPVNGLKGSTSPLTSSWESFSSPKELSSRREEISKLTERLREEEDSLIQAEIHSKIPEVSEPAIRYDVLLKSLGIKQRKQASSAPKPVSAPDQRASSVIPPLTANTQIMAQDYNLAAKPTFLKTHSNPDKTSNTHATTLDKASIYRGIERDTTIFMDTPKPSSVVREHKRQVAQAVDKVHQRRDTKRRKKPMDLDELVRSLPEHFPTLEQIIQGEREVPGEDSVPIQPAERYLRSQPTSDNYLPVSHSSKMFSSKPPSRYGPKPRPENGASPATVSLMLGRRHKPRPSTMYSSLRPRPLQVRYYTKRTDKL